MKKDKIILSKIVKYCDDIEFIIKKFDNDFVAYQNDIYFQYSCNMCIIQIGELITRLSDDFRKEHKEIPWHEIKAMRNIHAHDYESVNLKLMWKTLNNDVPDLKKKLEEIIASINE